MLYLIGLKQAITIIENSKGKTEQIFGIAETDTLFIFTVEEKENLNIPNMSNYVKTVDKGSGKLGSLDFDEYCDLVDSNSIKIINANPQNGVT